MPPLVGLILAGAGVFVAARFVKREMARVAKTLENMGLQRKPVEIRLQKDPHSGVYRIPNRPGEM